MPGRYGASGGDVRQDPSFALEGLYAPASRIVGPIRATTPLATNPVLASLSIGTDPGCSGSIFGVSGNASIIGNLGVGICADISGSALHVYGTSLIDGTFPTVVPTLAFAYANTAIWTTFVDSPGNKVLAFFDGTANRLQLHNGGQVEVVAGPLVVGTDPDPTATGGLRVGPNTIIKGNLSNGSALVVGPNILGFPHGLGNTGVWFSSNISTTAGPGYAIGLYVNDTLTAVANNDVLQEINFEPTFATGTFTGLLCISHRIDIAFKTGTGTIADYRAISIEPVQIASTVARGLYVSSVTGGATNYAIYTNTGDVSFGDRLVFRPATSKIVPGATSISLRNTADSADNLLVSNAGDVTVRNTLTVGINFDATVGQRFYGPGTATGVTFAFGAVLGSTVTAGANGQTARGLYITPVFQTGGFTGLTFTGLEVASVSGGANNNSLVTNTGRVQFGDATFASVGAQGSPVTSAQYRMPMVLFVDSNKNTASTTETSITSFSLLGNSLANNSQAIYVRIVGRAVTQNCTPVLKFGATNIVTGTVVAGTAFVITATITRTGATTQLAVGQLTGGTAIIATTSSSPAETLSGNITVDVRGSAVSGGTLDIDHVVIEYQSAA